MTVEQRYHLLGDGIESDLAFDQHSVNTGDRPPPPSRPARSTRRGSAANSDGGKPRRVGGSPAASPISRWARAKRVRLSMSSNTCLPASRNDSAIAVAA